jgi:hypothetical protein
VLRKLFESARAGDWKRTWGHAQIAARYFFGAAVGGTAAALLLAYMFGGKEGVKVQTQKAKDAPGEFLKDALTYNLLGGLSSAAYRSVVENNDRRLLAPMLDLVFPASVMQSLWELYNGYGRFKDQSPAEKWATFLKSRVAMSRSVAHMASVLGLGESDPALDAATRGFYEWRRDNPSSKGRDVGGSYYTEGEALKFRIAMRRAVELIGAGKLDEAEDKIDEAITIKSDTESMGRAKEATAASIRGRKLLRGLSPEELESLRNRIGDTAYDKLWTHDELLESWARSTNPPELKLRSR